VLQIWAVRAIHSSVWRVNSANFGCRGSCQGDSESEERRTRMSAEENKVLARRFFEEVTGQRNLDLAKELFDADYKHHDPGLPPQMQESRDAYIGHLPMYYDAFPDFELSLDDILAEGDEVAARWSFTGTHQGDLMGVPAT
jgi:hypothetical protein